MIRTFGLKLAAAICLRIATACGVTASTNTTSAPLAFAFSTSDPNCVASVGNDSFSTVWKPNCFAVIGPSLPPTIWPSGPLSCRIANFLLVFASRPRFFIVWNGSADSSGSAKNRSQAWVHFLTDVNAPSGSQPVTSGTFCGRRRSPPR